MHLYEPLVLFLVFWHLHCKDSCMDVTVLAFSPLGATWMNTRIQKAPHASSSRLEGIFMSLRIQKLAYGKRYSSLEVFSLFFSKGNLTRLFRYDIY